MINITKYSKMFGKKPANFLDNPRIIKLIQPDGLQIVRGRNGGTLLDDKYLVEFLLWLHSSTRAMITAGISAEETLRKLDNPEGSSEDTEE